MCFATFNDAHFEGIRGQKVGVENLTTLSRLSFWRFVMFILCKVVRRSGPLPQSYFGSDQFKVWPPGQSDVTTVQGDTNNNYLWTQNIIKQM